MKGIIESIIESSYKPPDGSTPRPYHKIVIVGIPKEYACWSGGGVLKVGQEIDYQEEEKNGRWKLTLAGTAKTGGYKAKPESEIQNQLKSFSLAYAKDLTCAMITKGIPTGSQDVVSFTLNTADTFYGWLKEGKK
jgi:hypothetical protein